MSGTYRDIRQALDCKAVGKTGQVLRRDVVEDHTQPGDTTWQERQAGRHPDRTVRRQEPQRDRTVQTVTGDPGKGQCPAQGKGPTGQVQGGPGKTPQRTEELRPGTWEARPKAYQKDHQVPE